MPAPFTAFTQDVLNHFLPGQRAMQDLIAGTETEAVSAAGALAPTTPLTELTVSGTKAYTLADGPAGIAGTRKRIVCVSAGSTPLGTVTIASPETAAGFACSAAFTFTAVGQEINLLWTGTKWRAIEVKRAGSTTVVVGTTPLTGLNLFLDYLLSVTATVSSTGANALPNGSAVGEVCTLTNTVAASTPIGNIDGVYTGPDGVSYTHLGTIGVVASATAMGDFATLTWDGQRWVVMNTAGCTLS